MTKVNRALHLVFDASLWIKGAFALSEVVAGIAAHVATQDFMLAVVRWVTREEFAEDPGDVVANFLLHTVQNLSIGAKEFASVYLLAHGVVKLWLIVGLLRKRLWYYPVSMAIFGLFVAYQLYRYSSTHAVTLLLITVMDVIVIWLTWHEYGRLRRAMAVPVTVPEA